jgi:hypothetical protein
MTIFQAIMALMSGSNKVVDPETGSELEGVSFL